MVFIVVYVEGLQGLEKIQAQEREQVVDFQI